MIKKLILIFLIFSSVSNLVLAHYGVKTIIYEKKIIDNNTNQTYITDLSYKSVQTQLTIGKGISNIKKNHDNISILETLEKLTLSNIVKNIELSQNKEQELEKYLKESNNILTESSFTISHLKQELLLLKGELDDCTIEKNISDKKYYMALKWHNGKAMEEAILESQKYGKCTSTKRILFNANREILNRLEYYSLILSKKSIYLSTKEDLISKHFDVIKNDIIEELDTKMVLKNIGN